jgi:hypothetical protein
VGPRAGLDTEATGKIFSPLPGIEPRTHGRPILTELPFSPFILSLLLLIRLSLIPMITTTNGY